MDEYNDEPLIAEKVNNELSVDAYIKPYIRKKEVIEDYSPEADAVVDCYSYTKIECSHHSSYKRNEIHWQEKVHIPEARFNRYVTETDFTMYDTKGEKIMTWLGRKNSYSDSFDDEYRKMQNDFVDCLENIVKGKFIVEKQDNTKAALKMKLEELVLPDNIKDDEYTARACQFLWNGYAQGLKNIKLVESDSIFPPQFRVECKINTYEYEPTWINPYVSVDEECVWSDSRSWKDKDGKEQIETISHYVTVVNTHHGYYDFSNAAVVDATFTLYNVRTGNPVLSETYHKTNDKEIDALTQMMKDFFSKVDKFAEKQSKIN